MSFSDPDIFGVGRSLALAHRAVLEIAMATIGGASSATAMIIAFLTGKYSQQGLFSQL